MTEGFTLYGTVVFNAMQKNVCKSKRAYNTDVNVPLLTLLQKEKRFNSWLMDNIGLFES